MKKMYKAMALVLCAVLLVAGSVMGTLAYLQMETDPVTNTFVTGKVEISLKEYEIDNETGKKTDTEATGLTNIKLVPGREIEKNPVITVKAGSEKCYLFVKVEDDLNDVATINWLKDGENDLWIPLTGVDNVYFYANTVSTATDLDVPVFTSITCNSNIQKYSTVGDITITAYAVQAEGFEEGGAAAAWAASGFGTTNSNP